LVSKQFDFDGGAGHEGQDEAGGEQTDGGLQCGALGHLQGAEEGSELAIM
jgi:hypothetical protein